MFIDQQRRGQRRGAGIAVGGERHRHAVPRAAASIGGTLRFAQEVERARQQHRHGAGMPPWRRRRARRRIRGDRPTARETPRRARAPCMLESCSACSFTRSPCDVAASNTRRVCSREKPIVSQKASTASTRPSRASAGSMRAADLGDVVVGAAGEFRRQGVRAEKGGAHRDRAFASERARRAQLFALVLERQAVAGLDLDGGHAFGQQRVEARQRARRSARASLAARVAFTVERMPPPARAMASYETPFRRCSNSCGAIAGVDQVGVAVDEAGRDPAALAVDDRPSASRPPAPSASGPA